MSIRLPFRAGVLALAGAGLLGGCRPAPPELPVLSDAALDDAIDYVEQALARDPRSPMLAGQLANRLIIRFGRTAELRDLARAETVADGALRLSRDPSGGWSRLAGIRLMRHDFAGALAAARRAVAADSTSADAQGALLEAAVAAGDTLTAAEAAARLDRRSVAGRVRYALWLDARGHTDAGYRQLRIACSELERAGGSGDGVAWCLAQLAGMAYLLDGPDAARVLYERARTVLPRSRAAAEGLAALALAGGDDRRATRLLRPILSPAHPDLYLRLIDIHHRHGDEATVRAMTNRFLAAVTAPGAEPLFGNLLALYQVEQHDPVLRDSALALARRDVRRRPTTDAWDLLAWVHFRRGELGDALAAADHAVERGPLSATGLYHRARILAAAGRRTEAAGLEAEALARPALLAPHVRQDLAERSRRETGSGHPGG